jgi:hypothetical protein
VTDSFDRESFNSVEQTFTVVVVSFMVAPTEATAASRRGTERCIGVTAIADFTHQVNPNAPRPDPKVFLGALWFVLSGLCDEIGRRNLGL